MQAELFNTLCLPVLSSYTGNAHDSIEKAQVLINKEMNISSIYSVSQSNEQAIVQKSPDDRGVLGYMNITLALLLCGLQKLGLL